MYTYTLVSGVYGARPCKSPRISSPRTFTLGLPNTLLQYIAVSSRFSPVTSSSRARCSSALRGVSEYRKPCTHIGTQLFCLVPSREIYYTHNPCTHIPWPQHRRCLHNITCGRRSFCIGAYTQYPLWKDPPWGIGYLYMYMTRLVYCSRRAARKVSVRHPRGRARTFPEMVAERRDPRHNDNITIII